LNYSVTIKEPLHSFLRRLAPEPHRAMRKALKELSGGKGDIRSLDQPLAGYYRLRVGKYRVIFRYRDEKTIDALFAEERSLVYEVFEEQLIVQLKSLKG
jgi:mRNA interferase RelE/StbE